MMLSHIVMPTILLAAFIIAFVACDSAPPTPAPVSTPTLTPTPASVPTPTPTPAFTPTLTPTPASVPTSIPTSASTPTPASVPTPTPTLTPNPTSVPMPTPTPTPGPSYLTEEIPPCTPVPGSSVDPCEPGAEGTLITESKGLIIFEPALLVEDLMSGLGTKLYVTHIVLRGTYLPGTVRCTSGHRNRYPSYVGDDWDVLFIYCFADVRVNSYLLGAGPPTLTVIVASILYGREGADDDDYGVEQLETRRSIYESVLVDGGRLKSDRPLRRGIGGREVVLFIGPSTSLAVEAWRVMETWDVERREDDRVVALHPRREWFNREEQSYAEMELPALRQAVTTAHQERVAAHGGHTTADPNFPMFVTDANRLRQFFSDPKVGGYDPGAPTPAPPPPPYPPTSVRTPTPTPASVPTPTPTQVPTPTLTPTPASVPMPTPTPAPGFSYLTEEIPPCTPAPGSSVDPCEPGAEGTLITESDGLILIVPPLLVEDLLNGPVDLYTTHVVLRGTYLPGTVRCTSGHRNRYPSYVGHNLDALSIYCFADVRVNAYLLGIGPSTLTVIVAWSAYAIGSDDDDYGLKRLGSRRSAYERALAEGGRFEYDRPLHRGHVLPGGPVAIGPSGGIQGREVVLFLGPSTSLSVEAWEVFETWDVVRREDGRVVAMHPYRRWFNREEYRSELEMELRTLTQAVTTAHQERVAAHGGHTTADPNFPMFVTDANRLRQFFSDPKVGGYDPGAPTPAPPPPPCGLAVPDQTDNLGLMRDCMTLLAAKDMLRGTSDLDWSVETTVGDWEGITTGDTLSRVTKLLLPSKSLTGSIPPGLGDLSGLAHLDLSSNSLTGEIPAELGWLSNLESLLLSGNQLTGCIPSALEDVLANDLDTLGLPYCTPEG